MHDVAGLGGARQQPLDDVGVAAARDEADVLAVRLLGDRQIEPAREFARLRLGALAERKAQEVELLARSGEQEVALVAVVLARAVERARAVRAAPRGDVVAGRQHLRAELARGDQEVAELDRLVAVDAGDRRLAAEIAVGEMVDHLLLEAALVVEHVVRDADLRRHHARVVDVLPGAARARPMGRRAVVVELQRHADHVIAFRLEQGCGDRGVDPARHGDNHAGVLRSAFDIETVAHGPAVRAALLVPPVLLVPAGAAVTVLFATYYRCATACSPASAATATPPTPLACRGRRAASCPAGL